MLARSSHIGVSMSLFRQYLNLDEGAVGFLAAIGPNAIGCAIGAFIGGRLGDKLGRKRIYQYDLLVYAAGILCLTCAVNVAMLYIGTFVVGLAVGADVPTSLALVGEFAPAKARGKLLGFTQVAWCLGPAIVLWMAAGLADLNHPLLMPGDKFDPKAVYGDPNNMFMGMIGARLVFLHLFIVALITWAMRRGLAESARWVAASTAVRKNLSALFTGANLRALVWTTTIYLFQNLAGGTAGQFNTYFIDTLHVASPAQGAAMFSMAFVTVMLVTWFVFMRFFDNSFTSRRLIWIVGSILQIVAYGMFIFLPFTAVTVVTNIIMFAAGTALAGEAFYKVFSQELFPTMLRGTAQGFSFGLARAALGFWSFFVPYLLVQQNAPPPSSTQAVVASTEQNRPEPATTTVAATTSVATVAATAANGTTSAPATAAAAAPPPNFVPIASILTLFLVISGVVGFFGMPDTSGKSLEQIETERAQT